MIICDCRENKIIELLSKHAKASYVTKQLDVGDFHICNQNNELRFVIERKTLDDLSASIIDGRYKEQKQRLNACNAPVIYIIEGLEKSSRKGVPYSTLQSAMVSCSLQENFSVFRTYSSNETADILHIFDTKQVQAIKNSEYSNFVKLKKKDNYTPQLVYKNMLSCIQGISDKTAELIMHEYPSIRLLIDAFSESGENVLSSIHTIGTKTSISVHRALC